ncbi:hypothetical protein [Kitasatospora sp. NPDC101183]|uniref:hypothetical protein n=1 Tax=Kitasatospora sp. NPDC101183 TaxID=3364100 RepID=UPI0038117A27
MNLSRPAALALTGACAALALALAGCGPSTPAPAGPTPAIVVTPSPTATPTPTTTTTAKAVTADENTNRTTLKVTVGTTVTVDLHSTYWSPVASSAPDVLAPTGTPSTSAGPTCRPGAGCGTVAAAFTARTPGTAHLTASRTVCGEALLCSPGQRGYDVVVEVTG